MLLILSIGCSWLKSQAGASNHLPIKKKREFLRLLTPAVPLACGGG
jgi:hypothetical protein